MLSQCLSTTMKGRRSNVRGSGKSPFGFEKDLPVLRSWGLILFFIKKLIRKTISYEKGERKRDSKKHKKISKCNCCGALKYQHNTQMYWKLCSQLQMRCKKETKPQVTGHSQRKLARCLESANCYFDLVIVPIYIILFYFESKFSSINILQQLTNCKSIPLHMIFLDLCNSLLRRPFMG